MTENILIRRTSGESNDTVEELVASDKSYQAGTKVGLVSGAKIVDILKKNSDMDLEKYRKIYVGIPVSQSVSLTESHARRGIWCKEKLANTEDHKGHSDGLVKASKIGPGVMTRLMALRVIISWVHMCGRDSQTERLRRGLNRRQRESVRWRC
ncbi:uncharacterized protein HD556DRAFT_1536479 [Suillus plorans]|uniref:Uncharacterized protein n=1 Tax=Suillus plorans TaxID=116603 RepID=A0A9P7AP10_9AGAM|nr:uncharacterized protein HD556DRAFT_1536479 [Suillus plorans]KAG1793430.1 hypothetical protein HD556DRAFT_1536479 [Suillus plorans]